MLLAWAGDVDSPTVAAPTSAPTKSRRLEVMDGKKAEVEHTRVAKMRVVPAVSGLMVW